MFRFLTLSTTFILFSAACAHNNAAGFEINDSSRHRAVCNVKFEKINGLVIKVKKIQRSTLRSRIDIERYEACPYNVLIKYAGRTISLDFINSVNGGRLNIDSVYNYNPLIPVLAGNFIYDGEKWETNMDGGVDPNGTKINVQHLKKSIDVRGASHGHDLGTGLEYFCYGLSIINRGGIAATAICSRQREDVIPWQKLFESKTVIQSVE